MADLNKTPLLKTSKAGNKPGLFYAQYLTPHNHGIINNATILMILIIGLMAGPAVSL